jgi:hypothetical protein
MTTSLEFKDNKLYGTLSHRAIPISSIDSLPQEHLNWALSRILEFATWLNNNNISHNGINPDSIYLVPETHGIIVISYYHVNTAAKKLKTISGRYSKFYPEILFKEKLSEPFVDIELAKRTIAFLAGDKSGIGMKFKRTLNKDWIDFLLEFSTKSTFNTFSDYRQILSKNFEKKFHILNI